jgi:hypothetical protein
VTVSTGVVASYDYTAENTQPTGIGDEDDVVKVAIAQILGSDCGEPNILQLQGSSIRIVRTVYNGEVRFAAM